MNILELFEATGPVVRPGFWVVREENYGKERGGVGCNRILGSRVGESML
jgi:hypothetical protein